MMQEVVGVAVGRLGKIYNFDPNELKLLPGDRVIVETKRGEDFGEVAGAIRYLDEKYLKLPLMKVVRLADEDDLAKLERNKSREAEAFGYAKEKIEEHGLEMQLFHVEQLFDENKMVFYFTAESRVDFRDMVKELAGHLKTRVELRQIGVRDKAKMVGGLGHCGHSLCCSRFLDDLNPVSIRMAKEQNLSLNPIKISGVCGRLMCCLQYEYEAYKDFNKRAPGKGACVRTSGGCEGCIIEQNPVRELLKIRDEEGHITEIALSDVAEVTGKRKRGRKKGGGEKVTEGGREGSAKKAAPVRSQPRTGGPTGRTKDTMLESSADLDESPIPKADKKERPAGDKKGGGAGSGEKGKSNRQKKGGRNRGRRRRSNKKPPQSS